MEDNCVAKGDRHSNLRGLDSDPNHVHLTQEEKETLLDTPTPVALTSADLTDCIFVTQAEYDLITEPLVGKKYIICLITEAGN